MSRGFTLLEMMLVVALLGIIAAIAVPNLLPEVQRARLSGAADAVAEFGMRARTQALVERRCVRVRVTRAQQPITLVMEKLNSFDCDTSAAAPFIDGTATQWILLDTLRIDAKNVSAAFTTSPSEAGPAAVAPELRYRATGRLFSADLNVDDDDAVITVTSASAVGGASFIRILFDGTGLICVQPRGANPIGAGNDLSCRG